MATVITINCNYFTRASLTPSNSNTGTMAFFSFFRFSSLKAFCISLSPIPSINICIMRYSGISYPFVTLFLGRQGGPVELHLFHTIAVFLMVGWLLLCTFIVNVNQHIAFLGVQLQWKSLIFYLLRKANMRAVAFFATNVRLAVAASSICLCVL